MDDKLVTLVDELIDYAKYAGVSSAEGLGTEEEDRRLLDLARQRLLDFVSKS